MPVTPGHDGIYVLYCKRTSLRERVICILYYHNNVLILRRWGIFDGYVVF